MNRLFFGSAIAVLAVAAPAALQAQALPAAQIGMVNTDRISRTCGPCATALQQLQAQEQQIDQRRQQLAAPLQTEGNALQTAINALPQGAQPDAALRTRIQAFQTNQNNAETEMQGRAATLQRNAAFVQQQISQRLLPAIQQVGQQRGATMILDRRAVLVPINAAIDVTDAVLAVVNQNTTPLNVTAPPPAQQPAQPGQQPQQPPRPRPQGR